MECSADPVCGKGRLGGYRVVLGLPEEAALVLHQSGANPLESCGWDAWGDARPDAWADVLPWERRGVGLRDVDAGKSAGLAPGGLARDAEEHRQKGLQQKLSVILLAALAPDTQDAARSAA